MMRNAGGVLSRMLALTNVSRELRPDRVLELASGDGLNLFFLASFFPQTEFIGVELTAGGVDAAQSFQRAHSRLPEYMSSIFPECLEDETAFLAVKFHQGNAQRLKWPTASFDLV